MMNEIETKIKKPHLVARRRSEITKAAMALFRKKGFHGTTMREICDASRVNRGSIYDYFKSKEDILVHLYKRVMSLGEEGGIRTITISDWKDLEAYVRLSIAHAWSSHRDAVQLLYRESISLDPKTLQEVMRFESEYVDKVAENLRIGLGWKRVSAELRILANAMVFMVAFLPLRGWNMRDSDESDVLDVVTETFMTRLREMKRSASPGRRAAPGRSPGPALRRRKPASRRSLP